MKDWNKPYPKKRQRLLNVLRNFKWDYIKSDDVSPIDVEKGIEVINSLNKRLPHPGKIISKNQTTFLKDLWH
jgi:hypothetical protein